MKKTILAVVAALGLFSCAQNNSAVVDVTINGAGSKDIVVSKLAVNTIKIIDTVKTNGKGKASITINQEADSPNFYYLSYNRKKLASLVLKAGDKVNLSVDTLGSNLVIDGSQESVLLAEIENTLLNTIAKFDSLSVKLVDANEAGNAEESKRIRTELGRLYVKQKQYAVRSIIKNPFSITNVNLIYQQITENLPIFAEETDILYTKRIYDSLSTVYPNSVYVKSLKVLLDNVDKVNNLYAQLDSASQISFPDITLPNINAEKISLSSLNGKPFILLFWSSLDYQQKLFNKDLVELYAKYKSKGLEIYQVCVDTDKTAWATAVKEQGLEWINVCDGLGRSSKAVAAFNLASIPSLFIFDKEGDLSARDVFEKSALDKELAKVVR